MSTISLPQRSRIVSPTSIVQLEYPPQAPLPKLQSATDTTSTWTRFVLLSDTHAGIFPVPDGDVLLHSGDLTRRGTFRDLSRTMEWLYALPHPVKIIIAGNRDFGLDREWYNENWKHTGYHEKPEPPEPISELLTGPRAVAANIIYLRDEEYKFRVQPEGHEWSVYGSPLSPNFRSRVRAFGYDELDAEESLTVLHITSSTSPKLTQGRDAPALAAHLTRLRPRLHVFGHIHEARGAYVHLWAGGEDPRSQNASQIGDTEGDNAEEETVPAGEQTVFVNASNWPAGPNATRSGEPVTVGGPGVQPVVVDLLD
ncbi:Metallophos domain-containing protein [Mycena sanguinolenta]|uniref:Metallophos domain-containing protein n=1 Tax=Mycena sanguinolenta TaxID=230812 RepID=A0A8H6XCD1_9AGAR|nr:Metallophos domain-containing protein [Mycena sanguinolenta]